MRILFLTSEMFPYSKTGGLGDVAAALPEALARLGCRITLVSPYYWQVREHAREHGITMEPLDGPTFSELAGERHPMRVLRAPASVQEIDNLFVDNPVLFQRPGLYGTGDQAYPDNLFRFAFFCRAALDLAAHLEIRPDIVHLNEWQTSLAAVFLKKADMGKDQRSGSPRIVLTLHNLAYQGLFDPGDLGRAGVGEELYNFEGLEFWGKVNLLKGGIVFSDGLVAVSPTYAQEIQTEEMGCGLSGLIQKNAHKLVGILNGVDYRIWNPSTDSHLVARYGLEDLAGKAECKAFLQKRLGLAEDPDVFLVGMITRLVDQKGIDLLVEGFDGLMAQGVQLTLVGVGEERYHDFFLEAARRYPKRFEPRLTMNEELAHQVLAGCDALIMPSRYEPCGLIQLYSLKYGTVPIVRATGGLKDTVHDAVRSSIRSGKATGFRFSRFDTTSFIETVERARRLFREEPEIWRKIMRNGMARDFSWDLSAMRYLELYESLLDQVR